MDEPSAPTATRPWSALQARTAELRFSPAPTAPGVARRFVAEAIRGWGLGDLVASAELLVSEVVTNVVLHAGTDGEVRVTALPAGIRVEVEDRAEAGVQEQPVDLHRGEGRGLAIVAAVARRWGVEPGEHGKTVWFELDDAAPVG